MDSFDAKMTLGKLLTQLQPYRPACMEICMFLLKNSSLQEELYPVILETLRKVNLNVRLNILQFIDDLVTCVQEDVKFEAIKAYSLLLVKDLRGILELVIPKGESETRSLQSNSEFGTFGLSNPSKSSLYFRPLANLPPVYEILNHISVLFDFVNLLKYKSQYASKLLTDADKKNLVLRKAFDDEDIYLNNSPSSLKDIEGDFDVNKGLDSAWDFFIFKKRQSQYERLMIDLHDDPFSEKEKLNKNCNNVVSNTEEENNINSNTSVSNGNSSADTSESLFNYSQKQLLERIENDRERQKRGKESLWKQIRPNGKINIDEFNLILNKSNNWLSDKSDLLIIKDMNSMWIDSKISVSIPNEQRSRHSQQQQQQYHHQKKQQQQQQQQKQQQQHMLLQQQHRNQQNWNQHPQYDYYNDDYSYQYRQPHNDRGYKNNNGPPTYDKKRSATKTQSSAPPKRRIYNKDITNKRQHNK